MTAPTFEDGAWYWVEKEGWIGDPPTIAPALYKAQSDAWYSFAFSGIPTREVKVLEPCRRAPAVPTRKQIEQYLYEQGAVTVSRDVAVAAGLARLAGKMQSAPAVTVPQFNHSAKRKLNYLLEAGETITGYAFQNKDGRRGSIDCHGFVAWWHDAAAPQPPEADHIPDAGKMVAVPVQLPEPVYTMRVRGRMHDYTPTLSAFDLADGEHALYTEQQVRQLLAAHDIQGQST